MVCLRGPNATLNLPDSPPSVRLCPSPREIRAVAATAAAASPCSPLSGGESGVVSLSSQLEKSDSRNKFVVFNSEHRAVVLGKDGSEKDKRNRVRDGKFQVPDHRCGEVQLRRVHSPGKGASWSVDQIGIFLSQSGTSCHQLNQGLVSFG